MVIGRIAGDEQRGDQYRWAVGNAGTVLGVGSRDQGTGNGNERNASRGCS